MNTFGLLFCYLLSGPLVFAAEKNTVKRFVYQKHTQVDLTGEVVQGTIRSPEVFYIFQRKRSDKIEIVKTPVSLDYQTAAIEQILKKGGAKQ